MTELRDSSQGHLAQAADHSAIHELAELSPRAPPFEFPEMSPWLPRFEMPGASHMRPDLSCLQYRCEGFQLIVVAIVLKIALDKSQGQLAAMVSGSLFL